MARVRNIGLPENDSERKAISFFSMELPDNFTILTNLELPTLNGFPYEYDMIIICDNAVYVIEVKSYSGEIKGNALEWELSSGLVKRSPLPLLNKKTKIVADRIRRYSPLLSDVWVNSILLLTDDKVKVKVNDPQQDRILKLSDCVRYIMNGNDRTKLRYPERVEEAIAQQFVPLKKGKEVGEFRVLETIGRNELYTTILAEHKLLSGENRYALKIYDLKVYSDPIEQSKHKNHILREANALVQTPAHPNLPKVALPFPWQDDHFVLPLEWIEGNTLRNLLTRGGIDKELASRILLQLCDVLIYIHQNDIVHRDLRPENVILPISGPLKLVNFNCAHLERSGSLTIATRVGKHLDQRYVAPEVWLNPSTASKNSDVFSFGVIFYEILTGSVPDPKVHEILNAGGIVNSITESSPSIHSEANRLFSQMCAYDPDSRMKDIAEIRDWVRILL